MKEEIADYFAGVITYDVSAVEEVEHKTMVRKVRQGTTNMLRSEAKKIVNLLNVANCKNISYNAS